MACSLRVDTLSGLRYSQFEQVTTPEGDRWMVTVRSKDSTEREAATRPRAVYIPKDIMSDVDAHANEQGLNEDDPLFSCTTRTIQRDVKRSAKHAATRTGNEDFEKVSAHDLRRYFATHLLYRHQVSPPVVRVLGGWKSDDAMFEYLVLPNDVLFERLGEVGLLDTSYDRLARHDHEEKIAATTDRLRQLLNDADDSVIKPAADEVMAVFDDIEGITLETGESEDSALSVTDQASINRFKRDEGATAHPVAMVQAGYYACVVTVSWMLSFGPLA